LRKLNQTKGMDVQKLICNLIRSKVEELQKVTFSNFSKKQRFCAITGIEISMQRDDSYLLSHKGLKHLIETDFERFCGIREQFLKKDYHKEEIALQIEKIAKAIRGRSIRLGKRSKSDVFQL
jgi:hypothetical protein